MNTSEELHALCLNITEKLHSISEKDAEKPLAEGKWSLKEVIGHLIDSATNNHQRFVRAQQTDKLVFPKYDQNEWVTIQNYHSVDWKTMITLWSSYNQFLAHVISCIPKEKLNTPCFIEPSPEVTLGFLVTDYLDHLKHHLRIYKLV